MAVEGQELIIKFEGGMAEAHKLPAYNAAQSLVGISRAIMIPAAYLEDGKVRYRNIGNTRSFQLNLTAQREGSFETVLEFLTEPTLLAVLGTLGVTLSADVIKDFIYSIINRCIGRGASERVEALEASGRLNAGDMAALVDAIEPVMREAHTSIGNGAHNVFIISGDRNVVHLNAATKAYVNTSVDDDEVLQKDFSIASFNANTGNGRAFDYEAGHTVAFNLDDEADAKTINAITESMRSYAHKRRLGSDTSSRVAITYSAVYSADRRLKKIKIFEARIVAKTEG